MDEHKSTTQRDVDASPLANDRDLMLREHAADRTSFETDSVWLVPCEALTRFTPDETEPQTELRPPAPSRFGARVGDIGLLVPGGMLCEIVEDARIYPLPTAPRWFQGLINLRGNLVPVLNLKRLFQMDDQGVEDKRLLILNQAEEAVGFMIDGVPVSLASIRGMKQVPLLPPVLREHTQAVFVQDGEVWVEFDFAGFFRTATMQNLA